MKVTMAELNKRVNGIINQVAKSGETVVVYKHGIPIAEIKPRREAVAPKLALDYLCAVTPVAVTTKLKDVLEQGRQRGI